MSLILSSVSLLTPLLWIDQSSQTHCWPVICVDLSICSLFSSFSLSSGITVCMVLFVETLSTPQRGQRFGPATVLGSPGAWLGVRGFRGTVGWSVTWHSITEPQCEKQKLSLRLHPLNLLQTHLPFNLLLWDSLSSTGKFGPPGQFCACPYCPGCVRGNH